MNRPHATPGIVCPLHKKDVSKVCHTCAWYTMLRGKNPNTGADIDEWGCAMAWAPILAVETTQKTIQVGAAIESFRNEVVEQNRQMRLTELRLINNKL